MDFEIKKNDIMGGFDDEAWYECASCGSLMYGYQDNCWGCGVMLSYDNLRPIELYE